MKNTVLIVEPRIFDKLPLIIEEYYKHIGDGWHYVFYCGKGTTDHWKSVLKPYVELREIYTSNFSTGNEYNFFMKQRDLWSTLYGEFVLTIQADTWIVNTPPYTIDYFTNLNKSYIGGNMVYVWNELEREKIRFKYSNFNGGLSIRKRLDMVKIIDTFPIRRLEDGINYSNSHDTDPEDVYFTIGCKKLGMPLGDDEPSSHFSVHTIMKDAFFGIHQPCVEIQRELFTRFPDVHKRAPYLRK
jgi:hypothetical protein